MALDRQSIEKRDFPIGRRGYDPAAVDAHLSLLADELEAARRANRSGGALASAASDQVRLIVEAAEQSASDIEREADLEARRQALAAGGDDDEEALLDLLRRAHHAEVFRTLARDVEGVLTVEQVADGGRQDVLVGLEVLIVLGEAAQRLRHRGI